MKSILLTNDDGINAEGIKILRDELRRFAHVFVVAPDQERSAVSHGLSIHTRLTFEPAGEDSFALNGTPADCVIYALDNLFITPPDMVISGINHGANLGDDIMYSGTVAAAREAARYGIPAIAVSQEYKDRKKIRFNEGSEFIGKMVKTIFDNGLDGELLLNVNIPIGKIKGMKITRHGCSEYPRHFNSTNDKSNSSSLTQLYSQQNEFISDRLAVLNGYVSITPLKRDQTDYIAIQSLTEAAKQLLGKF